jgi:hypothetical protein
MSILDKLSSFPPDNALTDWAFLFIGTSRQTRNIPFFSLCSLSLCGECKQFYTLPNNLGSNAKSSFWIYEACAPFEKKRQDGKSEPSKEPENDAHWLAREIILSKDKR